MNVKFKPAYITVEEDASRSQLALPFLANLSQFADDVEAATAPGRDGVFQTSHPFWAVQIVTAYQGPPAWDHDPDFFYHLWTGSDKKTGEAKKLLGETIPPAPGIYDNVSVVFVETMRDYAAWTAAVGHLFGFTIEQPSIMEQVTVVHEVGHVFDLGHSPFPDSIMKEDSTDPSLKFRPEDLRVIRQTNKIGNP